MFSLLTYSSNLCLLRGASRPFACLISSDVDMFRYKSANLSFAFHLYPLFLIQLFLFLCLHMGYTDMFQYIS